MEIFQERNIFLRKYADKFNWTQLSHNRGVTDFIKNNTTDLSWQEVKYTLKELMDLRELHHTLEEIHNFNYLEFIMNPSYHWKYMEKYLDDLPNKPCKNYFYDNWCTNPAMLKCDKADVINSIKKYIAATKIQRTFRRSITNPEYVLCKRRLAATKIQRTFRRSISNPEYVLCKRRLYREFAEFI